MTEHPRPVLMSLELAEALGLTDRLTRRTETGGVVVVTEADLLAKAEPGTYVEWGYPDPLGRFTPTVYAASAEAS